MKKERKKITDELLENILVPKFFYISRNFEPSKNHQMCSVQQQQSRKSKSNKSYNKINNFHKNYHFIYITFSLINKNSFLIHQCSPV